MVLLCVVGLDCIRNCLRLLIDRKANTVEVSKGRQLWNVKYVSDKPVS